MIISKTPLRVSLMGGGSDFPDYYLKHGGAVISSAIDKFIYVIAKRRFDDKIVLHYTRTETVDKVDEIKHDLIREALRMVGIEKRIEITTLADVPSEGTGLGSSSSLAVGLFNALYRYLGVEPKPDMLFEDACKLEIDILKKGIGKQDQYIAVHGGLRLILFQKQITSQSIPHRIRKELQKHLLLFYTGETRSASDVLSKSVASPNRDDILGKQFKLCPDGVRYLREGDYKGFGKLVDNGWHIKKQLADCVTTPGIEVMYKEAMEAGALGCKVCGAGGGGFLLVITDNPQGIRAAMKYKELPIQLYPGGSEVILR